MFFKNYTLIDLRVLSQCLPNIDRFRIGRVFMALHKSIMADCIDTNDLDKNDKFFEPKNEYEKILWESLRELAKKDIKTALERRNNGCLGGRPPMSAQDKKKAVEDITNNVGRFVGVNEVLITDNFVLPKNDFFEGYRKTYPSQLLKEVETWLIKHKKDCVCTFQWIGKQIQNFNKRKTGKVF